MQVTTPTGARCSTAADDRPPGASAVVGMTAGGSGTMLDSARPGRSGGSGPTPGGPAWSWPTRMVAPVSAWTSGHELVRVRRRSGRRPGPAARRAPRARCATRPSNASAAASTAAFGLLDRGLGRRGHDLLGGRVDDVVGAVGALDGLAADDQAVGACGHGPRRYRSDRDDRVRSTDRASGAIGRVGSGLEVEAEQLDGVAADQLADDVRRAGRPSASCADLRECGQVLSECG